MVCTHHAKGVLHAYFTVSGPHPHGACVSAPVRPCVQVAYVRLPAPPDFWRKPAAKKQQQGQQQQAGQEAAPAAGAKDGQQQQAGQQDGDSDAAAAADAKPEQQQQQPKADQQQQGQQQQQQQGQFLTSKQRRQLKRRQELAARAAERDSWAVARQACLWLVEKKLSLQGKTLAYDAAMEQVCCGVVWCDVG